jgi:RNA polymerase sigma-70 factor (ECF subfamily)
MIWTSQRPSASEEEMEEEAQIVARALAEPEEFAPLYERYFPRIYAYCLRRTGRPEEAEDLTSLIFTSALSGLQNYRGGSFAAWLFKIAHNALVNHLRRRKPQTVLEASGLTLADNSPDMLAGVVEKEDRDRVARLIAALPDEQRELLALRIAAGLSAREIGAVVNKSEGAVRVALHRIVQQLRLDYRQTEEA